MAGMPLTNSISLHGMHSEQARIACRSQTLSLCTESILHTLRETRFVFSHRGPPRLLPLTRYRPSHSSRDVLGVGYDELDGVRERAPCSFGFGICLRYVRAGMQLGSMRQREMKDLTAVCHQPQPPTSTTNLNHQPQPPTSTNNLNHQPQPPTSTTNLNSLTTLTPASTPTLTPPPTPSSTRGQASGPSPSPTTPHPSATFEW